MKVRERQGMLTANKAAGRIQKQIEHGLQIHEKVERKGMRKGERIKDMKGEAAVSTWLVLDLAPLSHGSTIVETERTAVSGHNCSVIHLARLDLTSPSGCQEDRTIEPGQ